MSTAAWEGQYYLMRYMRDAARYPILDRKEEELLARRWRVYRDSESAQRLLLSHLRLVASVAQRYRGYGMPVSDLLSEGHIGLLQALNRFDPDKGFRLSTYATWWIKSSMQSFIIKSWSLVKIGTTQSERKLFFKLREAKRRLRTHETGDLHPDSAERIARAFRVSAREVNDMNRRLGGDASLNTPLGPDNEVERQDLLADGATDQETIVLEREESRLRNTSLQGAILDLNDRERRIFIARHLSDEAVTLEALASEFGVSRERIRQIEARAMTKVTGAVRADVQRSGEF